MLTILYSPCSGEKRSGGKTFLLIKTEMLFQFVDALQNSRIIIFITCLMSDPFVFNSIQMLGAKLKVTCKEVDIIILHGLVSEEELTK